MCRTLTRYKSSVALPALPTPESIRQELEDSFLTPKPTFPASWLSKCQELVLKTFRDLPSIDFKFVLAIIDIGARHLIIST